MDKTKQKFTDKQLLIKGLKRLALCIPCIVGTTYLITFTVLNKEVFPLYLFLPLAILAMGVTIYLLFSGFKIILKALF